MKWEILIADKDKSTDSVSFLVNGAKNVIEDLHESWNPKKFLPLSLFSISKYLSKF